MTRAGVPRTLLRISLFYLLAAAVVALVALLSGDLSDPADQVLGACAAVALYNATASAGAAALGSGGSLRVIGMATLAASVVTLVISLALVLNDFDGDGWDAWGIANAVTLWLTQASAVLRRRRAYDPPLAAAGVMTILVSGLILALLVIGGILAEDVEGDGFRLLAAVAVVNVAAMLFTPIVRSLATPARDASSGLGTQSVDGEFDRLVREGAEPLLPPTGLAGGGKVAVVREDGVARALLEDPGP